MNHHSSRLSRRTKRHIAIVGLSLIIAVLTGLRLQAGALGQRLLDAQPGLLPVVHVNDGDTIIVREPDGSEETVRFLGVDTPEVKDPRKPVQCYGPEASAHTKHILTGAKVRLEPDAEDSDRDKYGRLLRYVYLPDGTLYNAALIRQGYGFAYTVFPITKLDDFKALEQTAQQANRGLWATCRINASSQIKQTAGSK
ncbi:MAG TPA: thermonuclease family protein [Candidatus Saccharimonadia bacterium]|nr:thermonuclease family protein [Candidatus Saccharimonadia bacterium]